MYKSMFASIRAKRHCSAEPAQRRLPRLDLRQMCSNFRAESDGSFAARVGGVMSHTAPEPVARSVRFRKLP